MIHFWVTLITFYLVFHAFRSVNWLIHVPWVIHYPLMNINCVDFCRGRLGRTQLLIWSPVEGSGINHQTLARMSVQNPESNKSLKLHGFLLFGKVCVKRGWTSGFYYIRCTLHLENILHLCSSPSTPTSLSLFLSLTATCCLSIDISHPTRNNTVSSPRWQWCMSLMGNTFQVLSL